MSEFNFESFIAQAAPRVEEVKLYPLDLRDQIDAAAAAAESAKGAEKRKHEAERDRLRQQMEDAALPVKVRALTSAQLLELRGVEDDIANQARQIAFAAVEPSFTEAQARRILEELPASEGDKIVSKSTELTFSEVKTPDFSQAS